MFQQRLVPTTAPIPLSHISNSFNSYLITSTCNTFQQAPPKLSQSDQLIPLKKNLPKKMREDVMNSVVNRLNVSKLEVNFSIDREGEHQIDCYQIFGSGICPICAKKHWYLEGKWWIDSQGNKKYYLIIIPEDTRWNSHYFCFKSLIRSKQALRVSNLF